MKQIILLGCMALFSTTALADNCTLANGYCVPVIGCIEDTSEYFEGRTFGKSEGTFSTDSSVAVTCFGNWGRTMLGMGSAEFQCDDGRTGKAMFYYLEKETGTALGKGITSAGENLRFWAGHNLPAFFGQDGVAAQVMTCGSAEVPLTS